MSASSASCEAKMAAGDDHGVEATKRGVRRI